MSSASCSRLVPSCLSLDFNSARKRRAAKSKSPGRSGPSPSASASSKMSSISPRSMRPPLPLPLPPLPPPRPPKPPPNPPPSPRPSSRSRSLPKPNAAPKRSEPPRSTGPRSSSRRSSRRGLSPLKPPLSPFSPLLPPCASRTTSVLPGGRPSMALPCSLRASWACSSVRKVTKHTPLDEPSSLRRTFIRSTSPTSSKIAWISSSSNSPTLATNTCFGLGSRGALGSLPLPLSSLPFPLSLSLPLWWSWWSWWSSSWW
mmetsp:Transcript_79622/g.210945  ORF Transcript_79622/g.210945 Transcript_79622/m.210945 type:complete len:258 (-) Transcript_79622:608-1381(-)